MARHLAFVATWLAACIAPATSAAEPPGSAPVDRGYLELEPPLPTHDASRIVVTEYFSYQCPYCFAFFPALNDWADDLPRDVVLKRIPVSIGHEPWVPIARAHHALEALGAIDSLDAAIFRAIHVEDRRLLDRESITAWAAAHGVDRAAFANAYDSFGVGSFLAQGERSARAHRIPSVPAIVVNGRFVVPIAGNVRFETQLALVNELIARERTAAASRSR